IPDHGQILRALRCEPEGDSVLRIVMVEGRNREIRRALAAFGFHAVDLVRIRVGAVTLDGLAPGAWRDLSDSERLGLLGAGRVDGSVRGLRP
ncbi:MAG TPA: hypothetical protein VLH39_00155, partial [Magnetospirillaceae bacterium]|nr:hypothetical protein [Magnetospirillaceae bacterium]